MKIRWGIDQKIFLMELPHEQVANAIKIFCKNKSKGVYCLQFNKDAIVKITLQLKVCKVSCKVDIFQFYQQLALQQKFVGVVWGKIGTLV